MRDLFVIAGPNGAGKSTAAPLLIGERRGIREFVDADVIAAGLSAFAPERFALEAGRAMLRRLGALAASGADFGRRCERGLSNFFPLFAPIADSREMHDNFSPPMKPIASRERSGRTRVTDRALWAAIEGQMSAMNSRASTTRLPKLMGVPASEVIAIFNRAGREAIARHNALGFPIVVWRDGKVV